MGKEKLKNGTPIGIGETEQLQLEWTGSDDRPSLKCPSCGRNIHVSLKVAIDHLFRANYQ
jgi:hypothetical protein